MSGPLLEGSSAARATTAQLVVGAACTLVAAHLALRVWMLWPSWFYGDDYPLVGESRAGVGLLEPYAGQFMPLGRLVADVVGRGGPQLSWHAAAISLLVMVLLADAACAWMLLELFGPRPGVLVPLAAYLTSAVVMPATMWWAAALNQLPLQAVLMAAVAAWVRYLRTGRSRWWLVAAAVLAIGLLAYVKTLLVVAVLGWLLVAHFASGGPVARVRTVLRRHLVPALVLVGGAVAFLVWYVASVPSIVAGDEAAPPAGDLAGTMLGRALPVGLLGGPWRWSEANHPVALADPPTWTVVVAWAVLVGLAVTAALLRRRTGRVWVLLALYAGLTYALLLTTRAPLVGGAIGLEYRYLTDVAPVAALCLGLLAMPVRGADEPTEPRDVTRLRLPALVTARGPVLVGATAAAVAVSGLVSSIGYARIWHDDHPARDWFTAVEAGLGDEGAVDVADGSVPEPVVSGLVSPWNTFGRLLPQAGIEAAFPEVSTRLALVDGAGGVTQAFVDPVIGSDPGPDDGCGHRLDADDPTLTVPLDREVPAGVYWLRVPYLASAADTVSVTAGDAGGDAQLGSGLGSVFVDLADGADAVTLTLAGDATVCVGEVVAGPLVAGPTW